MRELLLFNKTKEQLHVHFMTHDFTSALLYAYYTAWRTRNAKTFEKAKNAFYGALK